MCRGFRPGATLQGHVTSIDFLTDQTYDVHSYRPIFISAMAWVKASQLPDVMTRVFTDPTRTEDQDFPIATDFSSACFRNFFNDVFATQEYLIVDEEFQGSQAVIPPMIQTMEVVGGDELELSYDDYIYLLTGYYPKNNKSQLLGFRTTRGKMFAPTMLMPQAAGKPVVGAKFSARHTYSSNKNMIAIEPSFLIAIAGVIAEPNSDAVYGTSRQPIPGQASFDTRAKRRWRNAEGMPAKVLDRGAPFTVDNLRTAQDWLADPLDSTDPLGQQNSGDASLYTINYFMNGEVGFDRDLDAFTIAAAAGSGNNDGIGIIRSEKGEGEERFVSQVEVFHGGSTLQTFPDVE